MSLEELKSDVDRLMSDLITRQFLSLDDVKAYIGNQILPLFQTVTGELEEIDNDVADMVQQSEDILQPETAGLFAMLIGNTLQIAAALEKRLKNNQNDNAWRAKIAQTIQLCELAKNTLAEITVQPDADDSDDAGDDDEDDAADATGTAAADLALVPPSNENGDSNVHG